MATLRREEAERLAGRVDADPIAIVEKRQLADRLDAIAQDAEQKAIEDERNIPHGMVPPSSSINPLARDHPNRTDLLRSKGQIIRLYRQFFSDSSDHLKVTA